MHCTFSAFRIRCCQFRCILSGALRFYNLYVVYWWLTVSLAVCECVRVCVRCAECESAWHYCLYCKSCCNFVKISTLLVCPPARWSLSSVQQCHICAPQCLTPLCSSTSCSPCGRWQCSRFVGGFSHYCWPFSADSWHLH